MVWQLSIERSAARLAWAAVLTLPLWLPLPWLIRRARRAYAALTLCTIPYLVLGLTELMANPAARGWAQATLLLAFAAFAAAIAYLRANRS